MVVLVISIVILILIVLCIMYVMIWLLASHIKSAKSATIRAELEQEYQEKYKQLESEFAEKEAALAKREQVVAGQEHRLNSVDARVRFAVETLQVAEEKEHDVERREQLLEEAVDSKFAQRERELAHREHNLDVIIDRRVEEGIKGKQKGIDDNWNIIKREKNTLAANNEKYAKRLDELHKHEKEMLARAKLLAAHLGVSLYCILNPKERKLVDELANELPEERYKLIDLVMSCPDDQAKDLLAEMQQFLRNLQR